MRQKIIESVQENKIYFIKSNQTSRNRQKNTSKLLIHEYFPFTVALFGYFYLQKNKKERNN